MGEILDARFVDPQTIFAYGTFTVTDHQGVVVRSGKWGDVLRMEDGNAKFLLQSAYAERLDSMSAATFVVDDATDEQKKEPDFQKVHRFFQRFTGAFNRGDVPALTADFTKDAVRIVSGLSGVHVGRDQIRQSFESKWSGEVELASGSVLKARVLHTTPIKSKLVAGVGIWWLTPRVKSSMEGTGVMCSVYRVVQCDEVKLVLECAGSQSATK